MRKHKQRNNDKVISMPVVNPHAAGVDAGSKSHFVCVSQDNVKEFGTFTCDLYAIADHMEKHGVKTVAIESTGYYWQSLFLILQERGFEVYLVNSRHLKNVRGHKTDVVDSRWLQLTHSIGLLPNCFQPDAFTGQLRTLVRHRKSLVEDAARFITKMNKTLVLMNIRLDGVLRDLAGESGLRVVDAILGGQRDAAKLESLVSPRCKAERADIVKALAGNWRNDLLFELRDCRDLYAYYWEKISGIDREIERLIESGGKPVVGAEKMASTSKKNHQKNDPAFRVEDHAVKMTGGVDLLQIPGVGINTILTMMSETGFDIATKFRTPKHFASWLGFAPNKKVSGGKTLSSKTGQKTNPLSKSIRDAANAAGNSNTPLGSFFKRLAYKKGRSVAIVATARKICVIIHNMLVKKEKFCDNLASSTTEAVKKTRIENALKVLKSYSFSMNDIDTVQGNLVP